MATRCPTARVVGPALLPRHRFVIMPGGYASVAPDPADAVHGLLWETTDADMRALDDYEEVDVGLYTQVALTVVASGAKRTRAIAYIGRGEGGRSRPGYMEGVIAAARAIGLPAHYVARLATFARS